MRKLKAYYAHCMALYGAPQEMRDLHTIQSLGFEVINPNSPKVEAALSFVPKEKRMFWFKKFARECDVIFFRANPDGKIGSGVGLEIEWFMELDKPVFELPSAIKQRVLTHEQTRQYIREVGLR